MTHEVLVVGGRGLIGQHTRVALEQLGIASRVASRSPHVGEVRIDLLDASTFANIEPYAHIIVAADGNSRAFVEYALANNKRAFEATADSQVVTALFEKPYAPSKGVAVVGVGIFPGLLELLAREKCDENPAAQNLVAGVSVSPMSGAGPATISLMGAVLRERYVSFENKRRIDSAPMTHAGTVRFGSQMRLALHAPLADSLLLDRSVHVANHKVVFALRPSVIVSVFSATPRWMLAARWFQILTIWMMTLIRKFVLRSVSTRAELSVTVDDQTHTLITDDGMRATGHAIAAMVAIDLETPRGSGACVPADLFTLGEVLSRMNAIRGDDMRRHDSREN